MTDNITSQNTDISSWDILYIVQFLGQMENFCDYCENNPNVSEPAHADCENTHGRKLTH
jgi:hypothetical protein